MIRRLRSRGLPLGWGLMDQILSSASNFALVVMIGRTLGPAPLGRVASGFAAYVIVLLLVRALVSDPFIVGTRDEDRPGLAQRAAMATIGVALLIAGTFAGVGLAVRGTIGTGLLLFAPWLVPLLLQDVWRYALFGMHRGKSAAVNDLVWLAVFGVAG